jgi:DNA-binding MarR family transcriptional regulator
MDRAIHVELSEEDSRCSITLFPPEGKGEPPRVFEADSFESALRDAAQAGVVRQECIERQIAFIKSFGERRFDASAGQWTGPSPAPAPELDAAPPADNRKLTLAHYRGLAEFRYQIRRFVSFSERAAREAGLEPSQHQLLLAIRGLPPPKRANVATLAERMVMEVQPCQVLADALVGKGLVRATPNPADRREQLYALTPTGHVVLRKLTTLHRNQMLSVGPTFVQALGSILSSFEEAD